MPLPKLKTALAAVDWSGNIADFLVDPRSSDLANANLKIAIWANQFENADEGNSALCFVREMQAAGQYVAVLLALGLYKPAGGSMRSLVESALYYSFFRTHPSELATLARGEGFYIEKKEILVFHKEHTLNFSKMQDKLGVIQRLDKWYSKISSIVHGQIPGEWIDHVSVEEIKFIKSTHDVAIGTFLEGVDIVTRFLLCTVAQDLWDSFSSPSKKSLLAGLPGDQKAILKLDAA